MIRVLPARIVNQIAAGEVVERPFSVVKELVENSLDAGATRITVELVEGGRESIRVTDDGLGFTAADLDLAFVSHATSKLSELEDLDHIASLGFRGEALASIGAVSRAVIRSRRRDADSGFEVQSLGGAAEPVRPCGCPPGSIVEVRDLFFNTPARRRFLRTPRAERAKCQDLLVRLALARLDVDFTFGVDGRQILRLPAGEQMRDRVRRCYGEQLASHLLEVEHQTGSYRVEGLVAGPDAARRDSTQEILHINGRCAKDRGVTFAVRQAYREFLMHGRFPVYFLSLWLPPDEVDVNVHPTKSEVRFGNARRAAGVLHEAVKRTLVAGVGRSGQSGQSGHSAQSTATATATGGSVVPQPRTGLPDLPADIFGRPPAPYAGSGAALHPGDADQVREVDTTPGADTNPFGALRERRFLQVMDLYLVFEGEDSLVVVDQHALHERVLYEKFRDRHAARAVEVQRLLVPEIVELPATDKAWLLEAAEVLAAEGFLIEDFGGPAIAIQGIPAVLTRARPRALIETLLAGDGEALPSARAAIVERFHSMACRAAVMSGDRLGAEEIAALLQDAARLEHPHNCPHGRPTVLTFSGGELERFFKRRP